MRSADDVSINKFDQSEYSPRNDRVLESRSDEQRPIDVERLTLIMERAKKKERFFVDEREKTNDLGWLFLLSSTIPKSYIYSLPRGSHRACEFIRPMIVPSSYNAWNVFESFRINVMNLWKGQKRSLESDPPFPGGILTFHANPLFVTIVYGLEQRRRYLLLFQSC